MPLVHSRRWSVDRGTSFYGGSYARSYARRSSLAESSFWRRDAGRDYLGLSPDFGHSRSRLESSSSSNLSSSSFRSSGDSASSARRDHDYGDSVYRRRDRSYDSSHVYDLDRRYGSSWRDRIYFKTDPAERRDSSSTTDSKTGPMHADREIPLIKESYEDSVSTQKQHQHSAPSSSTYTEGGSPKKDSSSPYAKTDTLQTDRVIPIIRETPEDSTDVETSTLEGVKDSSVPSPTKTGTSKINLEIPVIREAPKAPYSASSQSQFPETKSAYLDTDGSQVKRDRADSGAEDQETGKCKRVRFLREDSPEGVSVPIIRTDHLDPGTKGDQKEEAVNVQRLSSSGTSPSVPSSSSPFPPTLSSPASLSPGVSKCPDDANL